MQQHSFGKLRPVSALTLGGGGIGMVWGETTFDECVATVHAAIVAGITLIDLAPRYGDGKAEQVVGKASTAAFPMVYGSRASAIWVTHHLRKSHRSCDNQSKGASDAFGCHDSICFFFIRMSCPTPTTSHAGRTQPAG